MSTCRDPIYDITCPPRVIPVGIRTEKGAAEVRFDVSIWKDKWPDMYFVAWATRPNEDTSYPVESVMEGDLLTWTVSAADTEIEGLGAVEVVGMTPEGVRKLSGPITTAVRATSINQPGEVPESHAPYYEALMLSNAQAQKTTKENATAAAQSAQEAKQAASEAGQYSTNADAQAASAAQSAASAGASAASAEQARDKAIAKAVEAESAANRADTLAGHADTYSQTAAAMAMVAGEQANASAQSATDAKKYAAEAAKFADDAEESVKDLYIIKVDRLVVGSQNKADKTYAEIVEAIADGKVCILADVARGYVYAYDKTVDGAPVFVRNTYDSSTFDSYNHVVKVNADGTVYYTFTSPVLHPSPGVLHFRGAVNASYNGDKHVVVTIPAGGGSGIPETADPLKQLVTDADGKVGWEERLAYKYTTEGEVVNLAETALTGVEDDGALLFPLPSPWSAELTAGIVHTVVYNGTAYECKAILYSDVFPGSSGAPDGLLTLGNTSLLGIEGVEGSNPAAPFVLMAYTNAMGAEEGVYGGCLTDDGATSVTLSVTSKQTQTIIKTIDPDLLGLKTIDIIIAKDGTASCDFPFEEAWTMDERMLNASIRVCETTNIGTTHVINVSRFGGAVQKWEQKAPAGAYHWRRISIECPRFNDTEVTSVDETTICIEWQHIKADTGVVGTSIDRLEKRGLPLKYADKTFEVDYGELRRLSGFTTVEATFDGTTATTFASFADVLAAAQSGDWVRLRLKNGDSSIFLPISVCTSSQVEFSHADDAGMMRVIYTADGMTVKTQYT